MILPESERLVFRNWRAEDRALFHLINSDERVMRFFPFRRTRAECDAKMDEFAAEIERDGFGFAVAALRDTGDPIGFVGITPVDDDTPNLPSGSVEIGWRLAPQFWGKGLASEGARAWLRHGFEHLKFPEIFSLAVWNNVPSIALMQRIGMRADPASDFDDPHMPSEYPELKRTVVYRLAAGDWRDG